MRGYEALLTAPMYPLALPDAGRAPRVLALGAHADDLEIGAACTLRRLVRERGAQVHWVVATAEGERAVEAERSARAWLGDAVEVELWDHPVSLLPTALASLKADMDRLARRLEPDLVLSHALHDRHQDHRTLAEVTWQAFRSHTVLEYEIPKFEGDLLTPSAYVPLDEAEVEAKCEHLLAHFPSQAHRSWFTADTFRALARLRGIECQAPGGFAEAFHARKFTLALA